jgi:hypothetical protein
MAKKARNPKRMVKQKGLLYEISKKVGRSSGDLVEGLYGVKVTPKVLRAQEENLRKRHKRNG